MTTMASAMLEIPIKKRVVEDRLSKARTFPQRRVNPVSLITTIDPEPLVTDMTNYGNNQYFGSLYLGSSRVKHDFIFDTGSPWFWVATEECANNGCHTSDLYDTDSSDYYVRVSNQI